MKEQLTGIPFPGIISEVELVYRSKTKAAERPIIKSPIDSYKIFLNHWDMNKIEFVEHFKVLYLNRGNRVLGIIEISKGGVSATIADPRLIFITALKLNATYLILCHNHPSGSLIPSEADKSLTDKIRDAGKFLDIQVIDHIILTTDSYYSFADEGIL